jgi:glycosyltransferase involved in cell wall biosynthesis
MITILLPVYNDEKYISNCLDSLLHQYDPVTRYPIDFKCLIGFNGTVDKSKEIAIKKVGSDPRFKILDFGNDKGKAKTLNKMIKMVDTKWTALIDGDDIWMPTKLWSQIINKEKSDVIGSFCYYIDQNSSLIMDRRLSLSIFDLDIKNRMMEGDNNIVNSSCFFKTEDALNIGGWKENVEGVEDMDFWVRLMKIGKSFYNIPEYLVLHRIHTGSNFNSKDLTFSPSDILNINNIN